MTAKLKPKYISPEEYLEKERESFEKHEYFNGEIFQMAGASDDHNTIGGNAFASLHFQLKKRPCKAYQSDMRVHIPKTGLFTYPDIAVVCRKPEFLPSDQLDTLLNPILIVEVLSPSTADYDKGAKFDHYRTIESLQEYLLVWQDKKRVARFTRQNDGSWILRDFIGEEARIELTSIECSLEMDDIYDKVDLDSKS